MSEDGPAVRFGAAYYAEYQRTPRLKADFDLMAEAGFSVIRVGESVWSTWEPEDGVFDLDWLEPVLDEAHGRGIGVILGTPTYAIPMWLKRRYPEIAGESATGQPIGWGARQEVDFTHAAYLFHAERVIRAVVTRYREHPAIIGYQVDNEPGLRLLHNEGIFQRFVDWLRQRYGTVERLNEEWGLVYWSHRLSTWADLWRPDGNFQPQYDLAWRRFQTELVTDFIGWQADIVRELAGPAAFVTTCISYEQPGVEDVELSAAARRRLGQRLLRDGGLAPPPQRAAHGGRPDGLGRARAVGCVAPGRPHVLLAPGAVPRHRDQRRLDRLLVDEPVAVRRAVAAGGLAAGRPGRADDLVLALEHAVVRHRDLLGRGAPAQWRARSRVPRARGARRRTRASG